ncbi:MAG TPA: OsmC family protein [Thermoplasmata archaeon]|nr:OsmC family protein [Thermoplasmata archaeon]
MQAVATWRRGHEILLEDGRAHSVVVDLPPEGGGTSAGTSPLELAALSLAGSLASSFVTLARKRRLEFSALTLALEGDPVAAEGARREIHGTMRVRSRADRTELDATFRAALESCPVARVFRDAQVTMNVVLVVMPSGRGP